MPVDVHALGCAAYAAAGQKWLCGSDGTGLLYVAPDFRERVRAVGPSFVNFEDSHAGFDATLHPTPAASTRLALARGGGFSLAATRVLDRAASTPSTGAPPARRRLAEPLAERGRTVAPRGATTLVTWEDPDPPATRQRLADAGVVVRDLPGTPLSARLGRRLERRERPRAAAQRSVP